MNRGFGREAGILAVLWLLPVGAPRAAVPSQMHFQGRIELPRAELEADDEGAERGEKERSESKPFTGSGKFKFAVVSGAGAVLWTNVPDSLAVPPPAAVAVDVRDGIFNVALGDPALGMPPLTPEVFAEPDRLLRVFFQAEVRDKKGRLRKTTPERELLPPQRLLSVPFAFASGSAGAAVSKETLEALLVGATVQGDFAIAQNAVVLGTAIVHGQVRADSAAIGRGTIFIGPTAQTTVDNTIDFTNGPALIRTVDGFQLTLLSGERIILEPATAVAVGNTATFPFAKLQVAGSVEHLGKAWLRFTRGTVHSASADGVKDSACVSEFGGTYMAASRGEAMTFSGGAGLLGYQFSVAGDSRRWEMDLGLTEFFPGPGPSHVACVHRLAPLRFTRTPEASNSGDLTKDAHCASEFGATYVAATPGDVMSQSATLDHGDNLPISVAGETDGWSYIGGLQSRGVVETVPLACVHN